MAGFFEGIGGFLDPGGLTPADKKRLGQRGLLEAGLSILANNRGPQRGSAISRGLLSGLDASRGFGADLQRQRQEEIQRQIAAQSIDANGNFDPQAFANKLAATNPTAALGIMQASSGGAGLNEFNALTKGLTPAQRREAADIKLGLKGRASGAAVKTVMVKGSDGRTRTALVTPDGQVSIVNGGQLTQADDNETQQALFAASSGQQQPQQSGVQFQGAQPGEVVSKIESDIGRELTQDERDRLLSGRPFNVSSAGGADPFTSRSPEQDAAAVRSAEGQVDLSIKPQIEAATTQAKTLAEAQATAKVSLPQSVATAQNSLAVIDKAINAPGRETATGSSSVLDPRNFIPGTNARDFRVILDQIRGKAFLEAFQSLKGGGQITEVEGQKATEAIARLNTSQSDEEFLTSLRELREIIQNGVDRARQQAGGQPVMQQSNADDLLKKYGVQ